MHYALSALENSMRDHARLWMAAGTATAILLTFGTLVAGTEPKLLRALERRLEDRLAAEVEIGSARPALRGVALEHVSIHAPGGLRVEARTVAVPVDLAALVAGRRDLVGTVRLRGVEVVLDPRSQDTRRWIRERLGSEPRAADEPSAETGEGGGPRGSSSDPGEESDGLVDLSAVSLEIDGLSLWLVDEAGANRELFSHGSFEARRSEGSRVSVEGGARLAGGGRLDLRASDGPAGGAIELRTTGLTADWIAPLLPDGVALVEPGESTLAFRADLSRAGPETPWRGRGSVELAGLVVDSDDLAEEPVPLPRIRAEAAALWISGQSLEIDEGSVEVGEDLRAGLTARYERHPEGVDIRIDAEVRETTCRSLVEATPRPILGNLQGMALDGSFSATLHLGLDTGDLEATRLDLGFDDRCRFVSMPVHPGIDALRSDFRVRMPAVEEGRTLELVTGPATPRWVPLSRVSPYVRQAVLAHEDATFYRHEGFAPVAIRNSLVENLRAGRFERGASTLSMQLAKNLYLSREKVLARKVREAFLTWWLERELTKDEILALYLNVVEFGPNLYGIGPASRHYFDASPAELGPVEGAFLATVLPSPVRYHRNHERDALSSSTVAEMRFLLEHMEARGRIDRATLEWGLDGLESFRFGRVQPRRPQWVRELGDLFGIGS